MSQALSLSLLVVTEFPSSIVFQTNIIIAIIRLVPLAPRLVDNR